MVSVPGMARGVASENVRDVTIRLGADVSGLEAGMETARIASVGLLEAYTKLDKKIVSVSNSIAKQSAIMGTLGQGLATTATMAAAKWEDAYSWIEKSIEAPPELARELRQLSTEIPESAESLAQLGSLAAQLGVQADEMAKFVDTAVRMGVAVDNLSPQEAIVGMAQFSSVMGESKENADLLASSLLALDKHTPAAARSILDFSQRLGGVAKVAGLTSSEVFGIAAAFASAGVEAERGATAISKVLIAINQAASQGGDKLVTFATAVGMTRTEFQELAQTNPAEAFTLFIEALKASGDDAIQILEKLQLTDQRLVQSFLSVAESGTQVRDTINEANSAFQSSDTLLEQSNKRFGTFLNTLRDLRNEFAEVGRALGQYLLPIADKMVSAFAAVIHAFNALPEAVKGTIGLIGGLTSSFLLLTAALFGLVGPLMWLSKVGLSLLVGSYGIKAIKWASNFSGVIAALGARMTALKGIIASQGLIGAMQLLMTNFKGLATQGAVLAGVSGGGGILASIGLGLKAVAQGIANLYVGEKLLGLRMVGQAFGFMAKKVWALVAAIAPAVAIMAAAYGAFKLMENFGGRAQDSVDALSGAIDTAAESAGTAATSFEDMVSAFKELEEGAEATSSSIAVANAELLSFISTMDSEEGKRSFLLNFGFQMLDRDVPPDKVEEIITGLIDALPPSQQFDIEYDFGDAEAEAESVNKRLDAMVDTVGSLSTKALPRHLDDVPVFGVVNRFLRGLVEDESKIGAVEGLADNMATLLATMAKGGPEASVALQKLGVDIRGVVEGLEDIPVHKREGVRKLLLKQLEGLLGKGDVDVDLADVFVSNPDQLRKNLANNKALSKAIREGLVGLGWDEAALESADQLADAWEQATDRAVREGKFQMPEIGGQFKDEVSSLQAFMGDTFNTLQGETAALGAFIGDKLDELVATKGHEEAIRMAEAHLDTFEDLAAAYKDEFGRKLINAIKEWQKELDKISFDKLRKEIESLPLDEAIAKIEALGQSSELTAEQMQTLSDITQQKIEQEFQRLVQLVEQEEQLNERRAEMAEDHQERLSDLAEDHKERLQEINDAERKALKEHGENLAHSIRMDERLFSEYSASAERLIFNAKQQTEILTEWRDNLARLQEMGLSQGAIENLRLDDPKQFRQVERLLIDAVADPRTIDEINQVWNENLDILSSAAVDDPAVRGDITERFDEQRKDLQESMEESRKDMVESYEETVAEINEKIAELGEPGLGIAEAVEKGLDSASPHIRKLAEMLQEHVPAAAKEGTDKVSQEFEYLGNDISKFGIDVQEDTRTAAQVFQDAFESAVDNVKDFVAGEEGLVSTIKNSLDEVADMAIALQEDYFFSGQFNEDFAARESVIGGMGSAQRESSQEIERFIDELQMLLSGDDAHITARIRGVDPNTIQEAVRLAKQQGVDEHIITKALEQARAMAMGGLVTGPTNALIGESGPEAVIPLNSRGIAALAKAFQQAMPRTFMPYSQGGNTSIERSTNYGPITVKSDDPRDMGKKLDAERRKKKMMGVLPSG